MNHQSDFVPIHFSVLVKFLLKDEFRCQWISRVCAIFFRPVTIGFYMTLVNQIFSCYLPTAFDSVALRIDLNSCLSWARNFARALILKLNNSKHYPIIFVYSVCESSRIRKLAHRPLTCEKICLYCNAYWMSLPWILRFKCFFSSATSYNASSKWIIDEPS